jgi:hypothetical protein
MNDLILALGREGHSFENLKEKKTFTEAQFKDMLEALVEFDKYGRLLEKKGLNFKKFLAARHPKTKKFPAYRLRADGKDQFVYTDEELAAESERSGKEIEEDLLENLRSSRSGNR